MTDKNRIFVDSLENWKGGKANGYYEPFKDEVHVLNGKDAEFRALIHEKTHQARRNHLSFKFASIVQSPAFYIFLAAMVALAVYGALIATIQSLIPFFFFTATFIFLTGCSAYEEALANRAMNQSIKLIQQNEKGKGGGEKK